MPVSQTTPSIIVIFGITGDLAQRYLLPSLYHLLKDGLLDERTVILGITRRAVSAEELLDKVELCVNEIDKICDPAGLKKVQNSLRMHQMSQTDPEEYQELLRIMNAIEEEQGVCMDRLYYLSIPPQMFEPIVRNLGQQGLNTSCQHGKAATRLLIEKPIGYDLTSARDLLDETAAWFSEDQMFRIDHYLAKNMVQNILPFKQANPAVEELWNSQHVAQIEIAALEKLGIEGRATFYEEVGALRDFIQSHLIQILALVIMDLPAQLSSESIHTSRLAALRSLAPISAQDVADRSIRGQYQGYRDEVANPDSIVETYAEITPRASNERWQGTDITLRTGKALAERHAYVRLVLKENAGEIIFHIQPDPRIEIIPGNRPADAMRKLQSAAAAFGGQAGDNDQPKRPEAYERVLIDAVRGDHTLFTTSDEVIASWHVVNDILDVWSRSGDGLIIYPKGSAAVRP